MIKDVLLIQGDARHLPLADESVQMCVTSPPYFGLRDYGVAEQIGLEETPEAYVATMVEVFREVRRVLKDDGTAWVNLGDSYASAWSCNRRNVVGNDAPAACERMNRMSGDLKEKDLIGIPWMVAFALRTDGWYLRQDIIWCLSGGTWIYARTKKGDMPMMLRDVARLDPATVKLWNGEKWTQVLGWSRTSRNADELELVLRSGERVSCTPTHKFPTRDGLKAASELRVGDKLIRVKLPEPDHPKTPPHVGMDAAWLVGLYLAEGSMSGDAIQLAGHASEVNRLEMVKRIVESYGGYTTCTVEGNNQNIRVYGKIVVALISELVSGRTAKDKCVSPVCWRYGNDFLRAMLDGYLSGDGHWDEGNRRWRLGFTRNYNLERDLRVLAARLDFKLTLNLSTSKAFGAEWKTFRGEIRFDRSGHWNEKDDAEVVEIRNARCREVYDVGVEDEPHLFALSSGILTHNSKPAPMPESVTDRCTKSHEYIFLLAKSDRYYFDNEAIAEPSITGDVRRPYGSEGAWELDGRPMDMRPNGKPRGRGGANAFRGQGHFREDANGPANRDGRDMRDVGVGLSRNRRSVWTINTKPYAGAHFATFPPDLVKPCILAGSRPGDVVLDPFNGSGTTGEVAREHGRRYVGIELKSDYLELSRRRFDQHLLFGAA